VTKRDRQRRRRKSHRPRSRVAIDAINAIDGLDPLVTALVAAARDPLVTLTEVADRLGAVIADPHAGQVLEWPSTAMARGRALAAELDDERARALSAVLGARIGLDVRYAWLAAGMSPDASGAEEFLALGLSALRRPSTERLGAGAGKATTKDIEATKDIETLWHDATLLIGELQVANGRIAPALERLSQLCERDPDDHGAQHLRARALEEAARRTRSFPARQEPCPCGSELAWNACCRAVEHDLLARFSDRSTLAQLRSSLQNFVSSDPALTVWQQRHVNQWLTHSGMSSAGQGGFDSLFAEEEIDPPSNATAGAPASRRAMPLAVEHSWFLGPDGFAPDDVPRRDQPSLLQRFADHACTPPALAAIARDWLRSARFGLWQVPDPHPGPGVWLTDLVTHTKLYAALPSELTRALARWSVLVGGLFPVNGAWYCGSGMFVVEPPVADRLTAEVLEAARAVLVALAHERGLRIPPGASHAGHPTDAPYGVLATVTEPMVPDVARLYHRVVGASLAGLLRSAERHRRLLPRAVNADGDPLELVTLTVTLASAPALRRAIAATTHSATGPGRPTLVRRPRAMTPPETSQPRAAASAPRAPRALAPTHAREDGFHEWVLGTVRFEPESSVIEVNSRQRLEAAIAVVRECGAVGDPIVRRRINPSPRLATPSGTPVLPRSTSPEADAEWCAHWLEEETLALDGATPRQAAQTPAGRLVLERVLRHFEHDADCATLAGEALIDVAGLRHELQLEGPLWVEPA